MGKKYAVIGDVMLDVRVEGEVERISPEAPVPILRQTRQTFSLGGVGNVAVNIEGLMGKGDEVACFSANAERDMRQLWARWEYDNQVQWKCSPYHPRSLTTKSRLFSRGQQLYRVDSETTEDISRDESDYLFEELEAYEPDAIVFADYRKGVCTRPFVSEVMVYAEENNIPVFVDTKPDAIHLYTGATLVKMNQREHIETCRLNKSVWTQFKSSVITMDKGGALVYNDPYTPIHFPATNPNPVDVTGAGDTTLAALAVGMTERMSLEEACEFAMKCAGIAVGKEGTAIVKRGEVGI